MVRPVQPGPKRPKWWTGSLSDLCGPRDVVELGDSEELPSAYVERAQARSDAAHAISLRMRCLELAAGYVSDAHYSDVLDAAKAFYYFVAGVAPAAPPAGADDPEAERAVHDAIDRALKDGEIVTFDALFRDLKAFADKAFDSLKPAAQSSAERQA